MKKSAAILFMVLALIGFVATYANAEGEESQAAVTTSTDTTAATSATDTSAVPAPTVAPAVPSATDTPAASGETNTAPQSVQNQ